MTTRAPCRVVVFQGATAYDAHNPCPTMEARMSRLPGSGSFYWPHARAAWRRARVLVAQDPARSIRVETISGRRVGYINGPAGYAYAYDGGDR